MVCAVAVAAREDDGFSAVQQRVNQRSRLCHLAPAPCSAPDVGGLHLAAPLPQLHVRHTQVGAAQVNGVAVTSLTATGQHVHVRGQHHQPARLQGRRREEGRRDQRMVGGGAGQRGWATAAGGCRRRSPAPCRTLPSSPASICSTSASRRSCSRPTGVSNRPRYCAQGAGGEGKRRVGWRRRPAAERRRRQLATHDLAAPCQALTSSSTSSSRFRRAAASRNCLTSSTTPAPAAATSCSPGGMVRVCGMIQEVR